MKFLLYFNGVKTLFITYLSWLFINSSTKQQQQQEWKATQPFTVGEKKITTSALLFQKNGQFKKTT
jgi:hypothetical protein